MFTDVIIIVMNVKIHIKISVPPVIQEIPLFLIIPQVRATVFRIMVLTRWIHV